MTEARIRAAAQPLAQYLVAVFDLDEELALESAIKITERQLDADEAWLKAQKTFRCFRCGTPCSGEDLEFAFRGCGRPITLSAQYLER